MALRLQNLFCSESEDFDDEDFLSVLEGTECSSSTNHTAPVRLRPIFTKDTQVSGNVSSFAKPSHAQQTAAAQVDADIQSLDQDVDDEELLSVCSEMEAVGSQEQPLTPGPRPCLRPINQTSQDSSSSNYASAFQLRPPGRSHCPDQEPSMLQRSFTECGQPKSQSCGFQMNSPTTPNNYLSGRGGGPYQSSDSSAKRLCLRPSLETQPVPSARAGPCLAPSTYSGCTTPGGASGPGQCTSVNSAQPLPRTPQMSSRSHQPSTLQTPIVTNHLVQLVTAANKTPQKLAWETPPPKERRFPGPAGLLPKQGSVRRLDEVLVSPHHTPSHGARAKLRCKENVPSQQPQGDKFAGGPWATMKAELSLDENDPACFLRSYSVVMVLRKAALKQLPKNKVPRMAVALKSLTPANGDASAVFQDLTGEIQGTVHHVLLEEREAELKVGSVLLLQQVGVFSPSHRNHYLNVTPSNLVKIYPPGEDVGNARVPAPLTAQDEVSVNSDQPLPCSRSSEQAADSLLSSRIQPNVNHPSTSHTLGGAHQPSSSITLHKTTPYSVLPHSFSSTVQTKPSAPLSSTAQARGPDPAGYHPSSSTIQTTATLSSTAQVRGPDPAGYHPSSSTVQTTAPLSSTAQVRGPDPAGYHRSSSTIQTKASALQSSSNVAQARTTQTADSGDWDMDDLDSLLCDLAEDPGD